MLTADSVVKIYDRWGRFYDIVFKWIFSEGRNVGVELLNLKAGEHLLEVGVGTGLSLPLYRKDARIVGIDITFKATFLSPSFSTLSWAFSSILEEMSIPTMRASLR